MMRLHGGDQLAWQTTRLEYPMRDLPVIDAEGRDLVISSGIIFKPENILHLFGEERAQESFPDVMKEPGGISLVRIHDGRLFGHQARRRRAAERASPQIIRVEIDTGAR